MIIRSSFVGDDPDRVRRLLGVENNEQVIKRLDLDQALWMFSALSALNTRARVTMVSIKCSPPRSLDETRLRRLIAVVERELCSPQGHPRKVIVHKRRRS